VTRAQAAVDAATEEADGPSVADWSAAAKLVAAVERLDERRREEWRIEEQRAEMAAIDESAIAGWLAEWPRRRPLPTLKWESRHDLGRRLHHGGPDAGPRVPRSRRSGRPSSRRHRRANSPACWPTPMPSLNAADRSRVPPRRRRSRRPRDSTLTVVEPPRAHRLSDAGHGTTGSAVRHRDRQPSVVADAEQYLGVPYQWGGNQSHHRLRLFRPRPARLRRSGDLPSPHEPGAGQRGDAGGQHRRRPAR
jgi:hypothetical protein